MALTSPAANSTALVTGASSGIGADICRELARRGHNVALSARRADRLRELAGELESAHGVRAEVVECDLTDREARGELPGRLEALGLDVDILVNNAGFATGGPFVDSPPEDEVKQVQLLCEAPIALCSAFVPPMVRRGRGGILNVASTAGMQPLPFTAGYAAAKAHLLSFSEALHQELRGRGVAVTALCPGPVYTEIFDDEEHPVERVPRIAWARSPDVARAGVDGLAAGRRVVIPHPLVWAGMGAGRLLPNSIKLPFVGKFFGPR